MTETRPRGQALLARYHEQAQREGPSRAWLERIARHFRPDERYERILALGPEKREALLASSPTLRMGLGLYEQTKAAHAQLQEMTR